MDVSSLHGLAQISLGSHVHDRILDEYQVELASQPDLAHISLDVFTFRIKRLADFQHPWRKIHQRHLEIAFEVRGVVPAPGTQLEPRHGFAGTPRSQSFLVKCGLLGILFGRG